MKNIEVMIKILESIKTYSDLKISSQKEDLYLYLIEEFELLPIQKEKLLKKLQERIGKGTSDKARIGFKDDSRDERTEIYYIIEDFYFFCLNS